MRTAPSLGTTVTHLPGNVNPGPFDPTYTEVKVTTEYEPGFFRVTLAYTLDHGYAIKTVASVSFDDEFAHVGATRTRDGEVVDTFGYEPVTTGHDLIQATHAALARVDALAADYIVPRLP